MVIVKSKNNIPIRVTTERWNHIITRHPEIDSQKEHVLETITDPDLIQRGDFGELVAIRFYEETPMTSKYLIAVYKEVLNDGYVITAYFANRPSERRRVLWKR